LHSSRDSTEAEIRSAAAQPSVLANSDLMLAARSRLGIRVRQSGVFVEVETKCRRVDFQQVVSSLSGWRAAAVDRCGADHDMHVRRWLRDEVRECIVNAGRLIR